MCRRTSVFSVLVILVSGAARSQTPAPANDQVPIYRVNVVERTVNAVSYQYRSGPTRIDFRGTVLLPQAKGDAVVEAKEGRTEIDARFEGLKAPTRFGREYLTYTLWAITPEGHAKNLGEVLAGASDKAKLRVTTDLQTFGLIVTAEPYSAVRQPGDVVVMENQVRPDTMGKSEPIQAKYDLLPRGHYTYEVPAGTQPPEGGRKLSMDRYQAVVELYQAESAVAIARSAGADRYAEDTLAKAEEQLHHARELNSGKGAATAAVTAAREAEQTAEDARILALQRRQQDELSQAREQTTRAQADAQRAGELAAADRAQMEADRQASIPAQASAPNPVVPEPQLAAPAIAPAAQPLSAQPLQGSPPDRAQLRVQLLQQLNTGLEARDTPRGLVVTVPDGGFHGTALRPAVYDSLARVAAVVTAHPGLMVEVDGNSDTADDRSSSERAAAVRDALIRAGLPASSVTSRGLGASRPLVSNSSPSGREQNRRAEIVIAGDPIGTLPYWTEKYSVAPR